MRRIRLLAVMGVIAAITVVGLLAITGWRDAIAAGGIALIAGTLGGELFRSVADALPERVTPFDRLLSHSRAAPARPADLVALERLLGWEVYSPEEFAHRVRPTLYRLARLRLLERSGLDIAIEPERAPDATRRFLVSDGLQESVTTQDIVALADEMEGI